MFQVSKIKIILKVHVRKTNFASSLNCFCSQLGRLQNVAPLECIKQLRLRIRFCEIMTIETNAKIQFCSCQNLLS